MPRRRSPSSAARRARVIELRRARWYWSDIGADLGITAQGAQQLYAAAIAEAPVARLEEHRAEEVELIDTATHELLTIVRDRDIAPRIRVEAWTAIRGWAERKAKLLGLDAPLKARATVISEDVLDAEIERLTSEIEARKWELEASEFDAAADG